MNITTYAFTMLAARILGPAAYGAMAGLMATVLVLMLMGRTINVISLAGLAFGVGQVLDASFGASGAQPLNGVVITPSGRQVPVDDEGGEVLELTEQGFYELRTRAGEGVTAVVASNVSWNGSLARGGTATFGFLASWSGTNTVPGTTCQAAV